MGDDKSGKLHGKETRPVLGDITNQHGKRGFSLISRSPASKSKSESTQISDENDSDSSFWKQVSLVVEKLEKDRSGGSSAKCPKIVNEVGLSPLKGGKTYRLQNSSGNARKGLPNVVSDPKEPCSSALDSIDLDAAVIEGDTVKESTVLGEKTGESSKPCEKGSVQGVDECHTRETSDDTIQVGVGNATTSKAEPVVSSRLNNFADMKGFGLERCTVLKGDGCNVAAGMDLLKQCSCSFCTKAAYIWSDLHYQDVKGRISTLEKSKKEASNLAQLYNTENVIGRHTQGSSTDVAQLDTDLMSHWRSLFLHMEDMFVAETNQLQSNFLGLKDLREDFKMNLEMINGLSDVQQSSSDASDHTIV